VFFWVNGTPIAVSWLGTSTNYCNTSIWLWGLQPQWSRVEVPSHLLYICGMCWFIWDSFLFSLLPFCLSKANKPKTVLFVWSVIILAKCQLRSLLNFWVPPKSVNLCLGLFTLTITHQYLISDLAFRQSLFCLHTEGFCVSKNRWIYLRIYKNIERSLVKLDKKLWILYYTKDTKNPYKNEVNAALVTGFPMIVSHSI